MVRLMEHGYSRKRRKVCDDCGSDELHYHIKGYVKCDRCKRLYAKNHKFDVMIE